MSLSNLKVTPVVDGLVLTWRITKPFGNAIIVKWRPTGATISWQKAPAMELGSSATSCVISNLTNVPYDVQVTQVQFAPGLSGSATPLAEPVPPPPPPVPPALEWFGDFSSGVIDHAIWDTTANSSYSPYVPQIVPDPLGSGVMVAEFTVGPTTQPWGSVNPRIDLCSPNMFKEGDAAYISLPILIPEGFPLADQGFIQVAEFYEDRANGSPPIGIDLAVVLGQNCLALFRDQLENWDRPWVGPPLDGKWHTITLCVYFSTNPTLGSVQVWYDGQAQTFTDGSRTLYYPTLAPGINWDGATPNFLDINFYRSSVYATTDKLYHGPPRVGPTFASVQPQSGVTGP